ncbi:LD-carboxypeptidase [uncultured Marivirga sp.]|uniref:S66 peptidase family protein n=1 Tax=uncultured Marivirga sp. TaxID=1123707 RepID=UPI0030EF4CFC|tara:strand:+ start:69366 stop:70265 length:900 start_codon:yes stop_codon:yes gene_type:complete
MNNLPPFLKKGDLILVLSPSGVVDKDLVIDGIAILKDAGYKVEVSPNTFNAHFKFGATHQQRISDLQFALDHKEAKAIYCARGGFGITHIIDALDWTQFKRNPKWVIGFSDITALLHAAFQNGFCSLHASVLQGLPKLSGDYKSKLIESLSGNISTIKATSTFNKGGTAEGQLIGGNLSLLVHQIGTQTELDYDGKILFIEEVAEPLYNIDRMLLQLKRAGKLKDLAGLVVGQFTNLTEDQSIYGQSVEEIILAHCEDYDFPIGFNFPFGHGMENVALVHGVEVELLLEDDVAELKYLL